MTRGVIEPMPTNEIHDNELFERGMKCEWLGRKVSVMTNDELITFIGQLDETIGRMADAVYNSDFSGISASGELLHKVEAA